MVRHGSQQVVWEPEATKQASTSSYLFLRLKRNCPGAFLVDRIPYEKVAIMLIKNLKSFQTNTGITVWIRSFQYWYVIFYFALKKNPTNENPFIQFHFFFSIFHYVNNLSQVILWVYQLRISYLKLSDVKSHIPATVPKGWARKDGRLKGKHLCWWKGQAKLN